MQQLTGIDAGFLNMETPVQQGHVGGIVIVDPATAPDGWGFETIRQVPEERLPLAPPVPSSIGNRSLRSRPPLLDRGPRLRS